jgi:hypothetical protein
MTWTPPPNGSAITPIPATSEPPAAGRGSAVRWGIAIGVTALVVAAVGIAIVLTSGRSAPSALAGHVPIDNVLMYGEVRLDLPGDQRQKLGDFLSKFPGFADQSTLDLKLDDAMDRVLAGMTAGGQSWTGDIKPWFGGQLAFAVGDLPQPGLNGQPRALLLATVKDAGLAQAWIDRVVTGQSTSSADYRGTRLTTIEGFDGRSAVGIIGGQVLVAGSQGTVEASVDLAGGSDLNKNERFVEARAALQGDDLGFVYLHLRYLLDYIEAGMQSTQSPAVFDLADFATLPDWATARLRAESDALVFEAVNPHVAPIAPLDNRASRITPNLPPGTIAVFDAHEFGNQVETLIGRFKANPVLAVAFSEIEPTLELVFGGFDGLLGWMDDVGFAVTRVGDVVDGGLIVTTQDRAAAEALTNRLSGFVALSGLPGASVREEVHNGTAIQIVDLGDWQDLSMLIGGVPFSGRAQIAYAVTDGYVVFGSGTGFVKQVLDAGPGPALADDPRFQALLGRVGADNTGATFIDLTAIRELAESELVADQAALAAYERDVKPFLVPFDAIVHGSKIGGNVDRLVVTFVVK